MLFSTRHPTLMVGDAGDIVSVRIVDGGVIMSATSVGGGVGIKDSVEVDVGGGVIIDELLGKLMVVEGGVIMLIVDLEVVVVVGIGTIGFNVVVDGGGGGGFNCC
jgi:hypothetical protein